MIVGQRERKEEKLIYINIHETLEQVQKYGQMLQSSANGRDAIISTLGFPPPHLLPGSISFCASADQVSLPRVMT